MCHLPLFACCVCQFCGVGMLWRLKFKNDLLYDTWHHISLIWSDGRWKWEYGWSLGCCEKFSATQVVYHVSKGHYKIWSTVEPCKRIEERKVLAVQLICEIAGSSAECAPWLWEFNISLDAMISEECSASRRNFHLVARRPLAVGLSSTLTSS